jgi:hypothetical protein
MRTNLVCLSILWWSAMFAAVEEPKGSPPAVKPPPASSLDDELFKDLDDATAAPGVKPKAGATPPPAKSSSPTPDQPATKPAPEIPPKDTAPRAEPSPATKPTPPARPTNPLDAELLKQLEGDAPPETQPKKTPPAGHGREGDAGPPPPSNDPVERLTQQIRDAEKRLARTDSGDETQQLQRKIVEDLEKMIAQIEQQQQQQQQSPSQSSKPQNSQPQPGSPQPQPGQERSGAERDSEKARDSNDGTRRTTQRQGDPNQLKSLLEKAWGKLPERERQDVMQSSVDDFPAKYQYVIEEYFKTLLKRQE